MAAAEASGSSQNSPIDITFDDEVVDISFHPNKDVIASGLINGEIVLHSYNIEEGKKHVLLTLDHHSKSCRALQFHKDGNLLFSASKDKSLQAVDMNTGMVTYKIAKAHEAPIYSILVIDDYLAATGDDDGNLKVWDYRRAAAIMEEKLMEEYITCLVTNSEKRILLASSGEGTLTAFNVRAKRLELQSELFDSELLSIALVKNSQKVVVGDGDGVMNIFNWGEWGNISDRFPGHPDSIDCLVSISDDIVCSGSIDGTIRAINVLPNRFVGIVGQHKDATVENLSVSRDGKILASCSDDQSVKFWDVEFLLKEKVSDKSKAKRSSKTKHLASSRQGDDFFADLT